MKILILILTFMTQWCLGASDFYAHKEIQRQYPHAFASMPDAINFHLRLAATAKTERDSFIQALKQEPELLTAMEQFQNLTLDQQVATLKKIFTIECQVLKILPPELIMDEHSIPGYAYFEFDPNLAGAGKVYINLARLKVEKNKAEFLILLIHETRHSAQFQLAQNNSQDPLAQGYAAAFKAQKYLKLHNVATSYCDFMMLLNEYEAFQFANYVLGSLSNWQTTINDMGTLAGQYDNQGELRMNLIDILKQTEIEPIELFNQLEIVQFNIIHSTGN